MLLKLYQSRKEQIRPIIMTLVSSLVEIQRIHYLPTLQRTPKQILRLHNMSFLHAISCKRIIGGQPSKLTARKLYGRYWHANIVHSPIVYRLVALSSVHTEKQERLFSSLNSIARETSSRKPTHILTNSLVRLQAEQRLNENEKSPLQIQDSEVHKVASNLSNFGNSVINLNVVTKFPHELQSHLERIADFLVPGEGVWWHKTPFGIEFHDGEDEVEWKDSGPSLHHFRSSTFKEEEQ